MDQIVGGRKGSPTSGSGEILICAKSGRINCVPDARPVRNTPHPTRGRRSALTGAEPAL